MNTESLAQNPHVFGLDRIILFFGIVEDRADPLYLGRCKIRVFGVHPDDKALVPTEDLPWAMPILPVNGSAGIMGMGHSPVGPVPGTHVVGFFADGIDRQQPFFFGTLPGGLGHFAYGVNQPVPQAGSDGNSAYGPQGDKQLASTIGIVEKGSNSLTTRAASLASVLRQTFPDLKDFQACALVGNLWYESKGFQAIREIGKGSGPADVPPPRGTVNVGYGWAQWTNARLNSFLDFANANGYRDYSSDRTQLAYLIYELKGNVSGVNTKKMFSALKQGGMQTASSDPKGPHNVDTIEGATGYIMGEYERPKNEMSLPQRIQYAKITLAALNKSGVPVRSSSKPVS